MKHLRVLAITGTAAAAMTGMAACGSGGSAGPAPMPGASQGSASAAPAPATLGETNTSLGTVLTNAQGFTLYTFDEDKNGMSACTDNGCKSLWPPVVGKAQAANAVSLPGQLATISRSDGIEQATYNGKPVYTFAQDTAPGQTKGDGVMGTWHALVITGGSVPPATGNGTASTGGGYTY
ncbi:hypothetical protein [Amycolatopsis sp. FDAARGOS 1241]|uniref:COG4315 family predicted lipoprotein n=1 Tax=Amycolatopsis sp. FDAARGOS 1241 TaxID=2778070 RepID=UPI0019517A1D|nr:hypothetical protein [Amycolatopsis sp. FDAARGOS 1241]QRP50230.1 hypothetical protein I6J71_22555 [Amycolatopsis sp. FDAARGOS 1241]